jgi:signal transduction histidine kinase
METDLDPDLPPVPCLPGELNQVMLNILLNAAHAIADHIKAGKFDKGRIGITTRCRNDAIEIRVSDNGPGIPLEIQEKIFDPFFTTKEVGKGTGQGLSIAHSVIVELHRGNLAVESAPGEGASFIIQLPVPAKSLNIAANDQY